MQSVILSTDGVPEAERFAYWREAVLERYIGVTGERHKERPAPFAAQLVGAVGGAVARIRARAEGHHVIRQPRDIARRGGEAQITVFRASTKVAWRRPNGQEWVTQPGDLAVGDTTLPFSCWVEGDYDSETWVLPRKLLDPHLPIALRGPPYPILSGASGVAGIIKAYLDAFAAQIDALDDREADLVADNFCRLLAVACGAQAEDQREPIRLARPRGSKALHQPPSGRPLFVPGKGGGGAQDVGQASAPAIRAERDELREIRVAQTARGMQSHAGEPCRRPLGHGHRARLGLQEPGDVSPDLPGGLRRDRRRNAQPDPEAITAVPFAPAPG